MNVIRILSLRMLLFHKKRTLLLLLGIILATAQIVAIVSFSSSVQDMSRQLIVENEGDWQLAIDEISYDKAMELLDDRDVEKGSITQLSSEGEEDYFGVYFRLKGMSSNYARLAKDIASKHGLSGSPVQYHTSLLRTEGYTKDIGIVETVRWLCIIFSIPIIIIAFLICFSAFSFMLEEQIRYIGILKTVGSTDKQIRGGVNFQAIMLAAVGIPAGVGLGILLEMLILFVVNSRLEQISGMLVSIPHLSEYFRLSFSRIDIIVIIVVIFLTIQLSSIIPGQRVSKMTAISAIRYIRDVSFKERKLSISKFYGKSFGVEGVLAAKSWKRNRPSYRATYMSMSLVIILFLVSFGATTMIGDYFKSVYPHYRSNVVAYGETYLSWSDFDAYTKYFNDNSGSTVHNALAMSSDATVETSKLTEAFLQHTSIQMEEKKTLVYANIISIDEQWRKKVLEDAKIKSDQLGENQAILINTTTKIKDGKKEKYTPFTYKDGDKLEVGGLYENRGKNEIKIAGIITKLDGDLESLCANSDINLIVDRKTYENLALDNTVIHAEWFADVRYAEKTAKRWQELVKNHSPQRPQVIVNTAEQVIKSRHSVYYVAMACIYTFIGLLAIIAMGSMIFAIATNISLRRKEFTMLATVGMTRRGGMLMLNLGNLLYSMKILATAILLAFIALFVLHRLTGDQLGFGFAIPWIGIAISLVFVLVVSYSTMRYTSKKLLEMKLVDAMRDIL